MSNLVSKIVAACAGTALVVVTAAVAVPATGTRLAVQHPGSDGLTSEPTRLAVQHPGSDSLTSVG